VNVVEHTVSMATTSKIGIKHKPLLVSGKLNVLNTVDGLPDSPQKNCKTTWGT
jgi:hypothetical protein